MQGRNWRRYANNSRNAIAQTWRGERITYRGLCCGPRQDPLRSLITDAAVPSSAVRILDIARLA